MQLKAALKRFDEENARDPNTTPSEGAQRPRELVYSEWLTDWVLRLCPGASAELRLAARCQHLCRWMIARQSYPETRAGYLRWREALRKFHAQRAGEILRELAFPEAVIERVEALNLKRNFPQDPESRVLEDALCLVFLEHQLNELAAKTAEDKIIAVLRKTWQKMSPAARSAASKLAYTPADKALLERAWISF